MNLYAYVGNDPVNLVDPSGMCAGPNSQDRAFCTSIPGSAAGKSIKPSENSVTVLDSESLNMTSSVNENGNLIIDFKPNDDDSLGDPIMSTEDAAFIAGEIFPLAIGVAGEGLGATSITGATARGTSLIPGISRVRSISPQNLVNTHGRTMSDRAFKRLRKSVKVNGVQEPIKFVNVGGKRYIVDGNHRAAAARLEGVRTVPTQQVNLPYGGFKTIYDLTPFVGKF